MSTVRGNSLIRAEFNRLVAMDGGGNRTDPHSVELATTWPAGTADGSVDAVWSGTRTLTAATLSLDLNDLDQLDTGVVVLNTVNFKNVKGIMIKSTGVATGNLVIGGNAGNAWEGAGTAFPAGGTASIVGSGSFVWTNPAGGATTGANLLDLVASVAEVTFDIIIWGESN